MFSSVRIQLIFHTMECELQYPQAVIDSDYRFTEAFRLISSDTSDFLSTLFVKMCVYVCACMCVCLCTHASVCCECVSHAGSKWWH